MAAEKKMGDEFLELSRLREFKICVLLADGLGDGLWRLRLEYCSGG